MTTLHTCSYRSYTPAMGQAVVISLGLPKWRLAEAETWPRLWLLTPTYALFRAGGDEFARGYAERLERFGPRKIARALEAIAREHDAETLVLLCHEANWSGCHRQQFADHWLAATGELVTEVM